MSGRPKVITPEIVSVLIASFHSGLTIREACWQSGISHEAYYSRLRIDEQFADTMARAQSEVMISAKKVVADSIKAGNINSAKWWVDRFDKLPDTKPEELEKQPDPEQVLTPEEQLRVFQSLENLRKIEGHRYTHFRSGEIDNMAISDSEKQEMKQTLREMTIDELYELQLARRLK